MATPLAAKINISIRARLRIGPVCVSEQVTGAYQAGLHTRQVVYQAITGQVLHIRVESRLRISGCFTYQARLHISGWVLYQADMHTGKIYNLA